jgi:hypothetical protein
VYKHKAESLFEGWCEVCGGNLRISVAAVESLQAHQAGHMVSAWLRKRPGDKEGIVLSVQHVTQIVKDSPNYSVLDKLDLTLAEIAGKTQQPGQLSGFRAQTDWPLVYAANSDEVYFYFRELAHLEFIEAPGSPKILAKGYRRLSEIQKSGRHSDVVFVAMWFDQSMDDVYEHGIQPAIVEAGYRPIRIDREEHANRIDDEIIARIRQSRFMVADFSGQRQGVYFESGMMLGLERTVIWICRRDELKQVHFDNRQYNFIDYGDAAELKTRLANRIIAIEGEGPHVRRSSVEA